MPSRPQTTARLAATVRTTAVALATALATALTLVALPARADFPPASWTEPIERSIVEGQSEEQRAAAAAADVLDRFHRAAAAADGDTYFGLLAADAVFIGTAAEERWSVEDFKAFAQPYFDRGQGWTYVPRTRHVYVDADRSTAWFDEILDNESYGTTRGTGVLVATKDGWRIAQYHLAIPIPNEIAKDVVKRIREVEAGAEAGAETKPE